MEINGKLSRHEMYDFIYDRGVTVLLNANLNLTDDKISRVANKHAVKFTNEYYNRQVYGLDTIGYSISIDIVKVVKREQTLLRG